MKERLQGAVAGVLIGALCASSIVLAKNAVETIEVSYDNIRIFMDGEEVQPKDANGQTVEPFIYNGTTYLPVRAVGTAIGKEVSWDGVEKVVYLGAKPGNVENWLDVCGPYQYTRGEEYRLTDNKYFTMSGKKYTNGFVLNPGPGEYYQGEAMFNLNGKFKSLTFTVGHIDGSTHIDGKLDIYLDGIIAYTTEIGYDDVAKNVTIPLNNALQMKIVMQHTRSSNDTHYGFSEGKFE